LDVCFGLTAVVPLPLLRRRCITPFSSATSDSLDVTSRSLGVPGRSFLSAASRCSGSPSWRLREEVAPPLSLLLAMWPDVAEDTGLTPFLFRGLRKLLLTLREVLVASSLSVLGPPFMHSEQ